jgi:hypothetical protein
MIGQYSEAEFFAKYDAARSKGIDLTEGTAWIHHGHTYNYYRRESDGSWTNYNCSTKY